MPTVPIPVIGTEGVRTSRRSKSTSFDKNKEQEPSALSKNDGDGDKSLLEILEINGDRIPGKDQPGLAYLIRAYQEAGRPASGKAIADWLDSKLKWLTRDGGMSYPKVFLWRLKQIQRGRFEVRSAEVASTAGILERMSMTAELRACLRPCIAALLNDRGSLSAKCARLLAWDEQKKLSLTAEERSALLRVTNSSDGGETSDGKRDGHSEGL